MTTHTGKFPIGFRRGGSQWQSKDLKDLANWAKTCGFESLDLSRVGEQEMAILRSAGLRLGTADLLNFDQIMAIDPAQRKDCIKKNMQYVKEATAAGAKLFFTVPIPGDHAASRKENYRLAVESYTPICQAAADGGAFVVIEGWPGATPWYSSLCCSPETVRAFLKDISHGAALNYDPSHLIRLGVDHLRFLGEFIQHIRHVHAKDTQMYPEAQYELGLYQGSAQTEGHDFGEYVWRYTIPGRGVARWSEIFKTLASAGYVGGVSVELEDENFMSGEEQEKAGLTQSLSFLRTT